MGRVKQPVLPLPSGETDDAENPAPMPVVQFTFLAGWLVSADGKTSTGEKRATDLAAIEQFFPVDSVAGSRYPEQMMTRLDTGK